jgi:hypothetical protein
MVAAAIIGSTVASVGASAISAGVQSSAARRAAGAQAASADAATNLQREIYNDQRSLSAPSARLGSAAAAAQAVMAGLPVGLAREMYGDVRKALGATAGAAGAFGLGAPEGKMPDWSGYWSSIEPTTRNNPTSPWHGIAAGTDGSPEALGQAYYQWTGGGYAAPNFIDDPNYVAPTNTATDDDDFLGGFTSEGWASSDPGYQFRLNEGTKALERSAAARGMLFSGATGKGLTRYAQDYASNEYDKSFNRLGVLSGSGQVATRDINSASGAFGANAANNIMASGRDRASAYETSGKAWGKVAEDAGDAVGWGVGAYGGYKGWWG